MHIHILGICGTFMGGLAAIAKQSGHTVTGCDDKVYPPMSTQLTNLGIEITQGFDAAQTKTIRPDVFIVGNVIKRGNPLMEAILNAGLKYTSGPQWISENILTSKWVLAVAGTHGKTSTASMLAWILDHAGLAPGFLIGGIPQNFGISARISGELIDGSISPFFVIEADEYDTAFFDKRSKFVHYHPRTAVLNNLEYDHADIFPDLTSIETQFHHLIRTIPSTGLIISNGTDASLERVLQLGTWTNIERFGIKNGWGWHAEDLGASSDKQGDSFIVNSPKGAKSELHWKLFGEHNRMNAVAAIAAAQHTGIPQELSIKALSEFSNVKRRMETIGVVNGITVYDDFAHHQTAIASTIAALREKIGPNARVFAVFEPRSNTMKLGTSKDALASSLFAADYVFCYAKNIDWNIDEALAPLGYKANSFKDLNELINAILEKVQQEDHILIMSNGSFDGIHQKLLSRL